MSTHHGLHGTETLSLSKAADYLIEECRMVLPGVQALFGFQLIAVFSDRFDQALDHGEKLLHLGAITLVGAAIALIMSPAAYHRITGADHISAHFIRVSTRLLMAGMPLLMLAISLDAYLVGRLIDGATVGAIAGGALFGLFATLWFVVPGIARLRGIDPGAGAPR